MRVEEALQVKELKDAQDVEREVEDEEADQRMKAMDENEIRPQILRNLLRPLQRKSYDDKTAMRKPKWREYRRPRKQLDVYSLEKIETEQRKWKTMKVKW
jgi:hypothetical protein